MAKLKPYAAVIGRCEHSAFDPKLILAPLSPELHSRVER
jgi:hypothetical protein